MTIVTLSLLKSQLNLDHDSDNDLLQHKIAAAEDWTAAFLGKPLADFDPMPAGIVEAVLQLASHLYENREAVLVGVSGSTMPYGVTDFLRPHRLEIVGHAIN